MQTHVPTTPFGRRPAALGQVARRLKLGEDLARRGEPGANHPAAVDKWRLFRELTTAREAFGLSDRSLGLLQALLSFHPETALALPGEPEAALEDAGLVVFPSNRQLASRANGMAEKTIRRHIAALVESGLIIRRDSPNGKRYARRAADAGEGGDRFSEAYGFDLAPLVLRAGEIEAQAEEIRRIERRRAVLKETISLRRRDIAKLVAMALEEGLPGPWEEMRQRFLELAIPLRRVAGVGTLEDLAETHGALAADVRTQLS
ncbi:MAG: plasmid replication protein RepC, partial [Beijerinckiaceae bacterium]